MRVLAPIREQLLDLKIRVVAAGEESPVSINQDVRAIDYLAEFGTFVEKQQLSTKQKEFVARTGKTVLAEVMEQHREEPE